MVNFILSLAITVAVALLAATRNQELTYGEITILWVALSTNFILIDISRELKKNG